MNPNGSQPPYPFGFRLSFASQTTTVVEGLAKHWRERKRAVGRALRQQQHIKNVISAQLDAHPADMNLLVDLRSCISAIKGLRMERIVLGKARERLEAFETLAWEKRLKRFKFLS